MSFEKHKWEEKLLERLWQNGWAVVRGANPGDPTIPTIDIVAVKSGVVRAFKVVVLESGNSTKRVGETPNGLQSWHMRAKKTRFMEESDTEAYFAVKKINDHNWYIADKSNTKLRYRDEYTTLNEAMAEWH